LPTKAFVTERRYDLAVKWRLFRHLLHGGDDPDAENLYRWHIEKRSGTRMRAGLATDQWKKTLDDYVASARALFESMREDGFRLSGAVPVDPAGELLDGSHRVACALALGVEMIPAKREARHAWAPPWGYEWFVANGMGYDDLARLCRDFRELAGEQANAR
jgi:hypothetical protein